MAGRRKDARGEAARARLVKAALEVFGESGFEAATTRMIASRARVNLAAIPYYFGSKDRLYEDAIASLLDFACRQLMPLREEILAQLAKPRLSRIAALRLLERFVGGYVRLATHPEVAIYAPLILREQVCPTHAFDIVYERMMAPQHQLCCELLSRVLGIKPDSREAIFRTQMLLGQAMFFIAGRGVIMRRLGQDSFSKRDIEDILKIITDGIRQLRASARKGGRS